MKKIDYYGTNNPWHLPKWVGIGLGGVFAVMVVGSMIAIVQLTRPPAPPAVIVSPPVATAAPVAPAPAVATPVATAHTEPAAPAQARAPATIARVHKRHAAAKGEHGATPKRAVALKAGADENRRAAIVAKHDSKDKQRDKDALDKLLGL